MRLTGWQKSKLLFAASLVGFPVVAQAENIQEVDIPSQPLSEAIAELGDETGMQISAASELVEGKQSNPVNGFMTPRDALKLLLNGTGIKATSIPGNGAVLAQAAVADGEETVLDRIVVEGERVQRSVFDTSSSVTVITDENLEDEKGRRELRDLWVSVPNVFDEVGSNNAPTIRGIDSTGPATGGGAFTGGARPRTSVVVDGRTLSSSELSFAENGLWDVDQVEVFTGPQTTTNGTNSIAGAVFINTKDPTFEFETSLRTFFGSRDHQAVAGMVNVPLSDEFAVRATFNYEKQETWRDAIAIPPVDELDNEELLNFRIKALHEPASIPGLTSLITIQRNDDSGPQTLLSDPPFENRQSVNPGEATFLNDYTSGVHTLTYDSGAGWVFTNVFQMAESSSTRDSIGPFGTITLNGDEIGNESRVNFEAMDGRLNGVFGGSWLEREEDLDAVVPLIGFNLNDGVTGTNESYGIFGEFTYDVTDDWHLTIGARWQEDTSQRNAIPIPIFGIPAGFSFNETFSAFLPKASLAYDINEELRIGVLYSQGFNPGGINQSVPLSNPALAIFSPYDEETSDNFELFLRYNGYGGDLQITANAFYTVLDGYQASLTNINNPADPNDDTSEIVNVDEAETLGLDLTADARVNERLKINASLGLLSTEITQNVATPTTVGNELIRAPEITASLGVQYDVTDAFNIGGRIRYVGDFYGDLANSASTQAGDYTVVDLNASWKPTENFEAFAFVNNVFDNDYIVNAFGVGANRRVGFGDPLEAGFGVQVKF